jgi:hypothetical protein
MKRFYSHRPNAYRCLVVTGDGLLHCDPGFIVAQRDDPTNARWTQFCDAYDAATGHSTRFTNFTFQGVTFKIKSCNDGDHDGVGVDSGLLCKVDLKQAHAAFGFQLYDQGETFAKSGATPISIEDLLHEIEDYQAGNKIIEQAAAKLGVRLHRHQDCDNDDFEVVRRLTARKASDRYNRPRLSTEAAIQAVQQAHIELPKRQQDVDARFGNAARQHKITLWSLFPL